MKINTRWLKDSFNINLAPERLADLLTMLGFEVERIEKRREDYVLDVNLTPNRPDCLSHAGIAREVCAALRKKFKLRNIRVKECDRRISDFLSVRIDAKEGCPRYSARVILDVKIGESPEWLRDLLESVGIRSVNNAVDATNFVLMELGHPLHAFDLDRVSGGRILIRRAMRGEKLRTLDGVERSLEDDDLVIADINSPIALAGIMGGEETEVTPGTRNILLESAVFEPASIRATSRRANIETEASLRFGRAVDPGILLMALDKTAVLIAELTGGRLAKGRIDLHTGRRKGADIRLNHDEMCDFLGTVIGVSQTTRILKSLGFGVKNKGRKTIVSVPEFRSDVREPADLYEEVARHYGYNMIPSLLPGDRLYKPLKIEEDTIDRIISIFTSSGFMEVITYSFIHPRSFDKLILDDSDRRRNAVEILNPLSQDRSIMRTFLIPGLLEIASYNIYHRSYNLRFFEIGKVFHPVSNNAPPHEVTLLAGIVTGFIDRGWHEPMREVDFFDVKGIVEYMFEACGKRFEIERGNEPYLHPGKSVKVYVDGKETGYFGELHPVVKEGFDIKGGAVVLEFDMEYLAERKTGEILFKPLPKFTHIERDISAIVDRDVAARRLVELSLGTNTALIAGVDIFDIYEGQNLPEGKKSIGLRIKIQPGDKNLTDDEIDRIISEIMNRLVNEVNAEFRGGSV